MIPTSLCLYYNAKTSLKEYLFVGLAFLSGIVSVYMLTTSPNRFPLLFDQVSSFAYITVYFFFLLYAMRITSNPPKITYLGILWYVFMLYSILSYELTAVTDEMDVLFIEMRKTANTPSVLGIFQINDVIISGEGFEFIYDLFRFYVFALILYMYLTTELALKTASTVRLWRIWIIAVSFHLLVSFLNIGNSLKFWEVQIEIISGLTLIILILVGYIAIRHPEAFLITHTQLMRAFSIYGNISKREREAQNLKFGLQRIIDYIESISVEGKVV